MSLVKRVKNKINEYDIILYDNYDIEGEDSHVFYIENAIIFIDLKKETMSVTFQATTRPDRVATLALILNEVKCKAMYVMESFIFNGDNECVSGDEAFELIEKTKHLKAVHEVQEQFYYKEILEKERGFECWLKKI